MNVVMVGLGKMGGPMLRLLHEAGWKVVGCDADARARAVMDDLGVTTVNEVGAAVDSMTGPRVVWLMLPAGNATAAVVESLADVLTDGDLVVDGGNSDFRDAAARAAILGASGVGFADIGVSGGQWGWQTGYGMTIGASVDHYEQLRPALELLCGPGGYARVGGVAAGHLAKAVHNGVQYGILQAYAEGYAVLAAHRDLDANAVMAAWQGGASVRSWLLEQIVATLADNPSLDDVSTEVSDSGMGRWTAEEAVRLAVPTPVLAAALHARFASRDDRIANRLLTAARGRIGGQQR